MCRRRSVGIDRVSNRSGWSRRTSACCGSRFGGRPHDGGSAHSGPRRCLRARRARQVRLQNKRRWDNAVHRNNTVHWNDVVRFNNTVRWTNAVHWNNTVHWNNVMKFNNMVHWNNVVKLNARGEACGARARHDLACCGGALPPCYVLLRESGGYSKAKNPTSTASGLWRVHRRNVGRIRRLRPRLGCAGGRQNARAVQVWAHGAGCSNGRPARSSSDPRRHGRRSTEPKCRLRRHCAGRSRVSVPATSS